MRKKFLHYAAVGVLSASLIGGTVYADNTGRSSRINSSGILHFQNGDDASQSVHLDASDLMILANEIDNLETEYKSGILTRLNGIGTYFDGEGNFTHENHTTENPNLLIFSQLLDGISNSQTVDTDTIADNLSEGKGAWVNGKYIIGNGADVKAAYAQGYADHVPGNAHIEYIYHEHSGDASNGGGCYSRGHNHTSSCGKKSTCGQRGSTGTGGGSWSCPIHGITQYLWSEGQGGGYTLWGCDYPVAPYYTCGNSPLNAWVVSCGKTTDTIVGATIVWDE